MHPEIEVNTMKLFFAELTAMELDLEAIPELGDVRAWIKHKTFFVMAEDAQEVVRALKPHLFNDLHLQRDRDKEDVWNRLWEYIVEEELKHPFKLKLAEITSFNEDGVMVVCEDYSSVPKEIVPEPDSLALVNHLLPPSPGYKKYMESCS